jgi:hypothetical protein
MSANLTAPDERRRTKRQPFRGDHASLHATVPAALREHAEREAAELGITVSTIITRLLIGRYGEPPAVELVPSPLPLRPSTD